MKSTITLLVFCVSGLLALGLVMLYSAGYYLREDGTHFFKMQLAWAAMGVIACVAATCLDYRSWRKIAWPVFALAIVALIAVFFYPKVNGAQRWIRFGGFSFQASELAKLALILVVGWYVERYHSKMTTFRRGIMIPLAFVGIILALVIKQPDVGTTMLLASVSFAVLFLGGMRIRYFVLPAVVAVTALVIFLKHNDVRRERINAWLNPEETKMAAGHQAWEARLAFGAGGLTGRGLGSSRQKFGPLAEHHTDFIFPIIGEELGLPATLGVVAAFMVLASCGYRISTRAPDTFGMLVAAGITLLITVQALVNIAVVTGTVPNKGLPLPFISYGGSSLLLTLLMVGILLSIARKAVPATQHVGNELPGSSDLVAHLS
jgi:cell division protein FtsW